MVATAPVADVDWVRNFTSRKKPPDLKSNAYNDPVAFATGAVAGQAMSRMALNSGNVSPDDLNFNVPSRDVDPAGSAIMASGMMALTAFAADGMVDAKYKGGPARLGFLHFARQYNRQYVGGEQGVTAVKLLGIGSSWQVRWAGLDNRDLYATGASRTAMSGTLNAVLANGGPPAMKAVFERKWPKSAGGNPSANEWIRWLDEGIKKSGNTPGAWRGQTPFVAERGLAGAYITSLADILAMPARFQREARGEPLPEGFATLFHLESMFNQRNCQTINFSLAAGVTDIDLKLDEITSSCVRLRWTGPEFGPDHARPPVAISAYGEGLDYTDLDALLLASAGKERVGLSVSDSESGKTAKTWMVDYAPDFDGDDAMTLVFANVAPDAASTRPLSIRLTVGTGITAGQGDLVAQVNTAPPNETCSPRAVPMPALADSVPYPGLVSLSLGLESGLVPVGEFGPLVGLASQFASDQPSGELQTRFCSATLRWNTAKDGLSALFNGQGGKASACIPDLSDVARAVESRKKRAHYRRFALNPSEGADLSADVIPVTASISWTDPSLPVYSTPRAMGPDDRTDDPKAEMEGFLTFQIRTETRLRGRIDLAVPPPAVNDQATCNASPEGSITLMFDVVAALPDAGQSRLIGPDPLAAISPDVWANMTVATREANIARSNRERRGDTKRDQVPSKTGRDEPCLCTCTQYSDPASKALCAPSCSERFEAFCKADALSEAEKACYVQLVTGPMPAAVRQRTAQELRRSLEGVDPEILKGMIRSQSEELKAEGRTCE